MRTFASTLRALKRVAVLFSVLGVAASIDTIASVSPAEARANVGTWDGPIYVAPKLTRSKASYKKSNRKSGTAYKATRKKGKKYAALGKSSMNDASPYSKSVTGGGVRWAANAGCLNGSLKSVIYSVASSYGAVTVSSTCRSRGHNARVGGAKKSYHLTGSAADFRVHGNWRAAYAYLRSSGSVGGFKHYGGGLFHIDTGPRRAF
jgi:uncharacterized protein YcbK (DUF882 family)